MARVIPELTWPESWLGPLPSAREIKFACLCSLGFAVLLLVLVLALGRERAAALGLRYQEDFVAFYGVGQLLNEHPPDRLYDFQVQSDIYRQLRPGATHLELPYVHAPFEALLFKPLGALPYDLAYVVWLCVGMLAFLAGVLLLMRRFGPHDGPDRTVVLSLAVAYSPYMMEAWLGGNVTVLPFLAIAAAIALEDAGRPVLGGCALAIAANKPSFLVLILPMLVVSRRLHLLAGFLIGALALVVLSSMVLGLQTWQDFASTLVRWAQMTGSQPGLFRDWKYVDVNAFTRVLPGGRTWFGLALTTALSTWVLLDLLRMWRAAPAGGRPARSLAWAATITWTLVLSPYVPIYDCTLLVVAGILAASAILDPATHRRPPAFVAAVAMCFLLAWVTQPIAEAVRLQIYTLVLIYSGILLMRQFRRVLSHAVPPPPMAVAQPMHGSPT